MVSSYSYNILKAWMQKDSDKPLGAEKHLLAGTIAGTCNTTLAPQLVQNFAARVLTDTKSFNHISPILRELGWPSIKDQLLVRDTTQVYKIVNGLAPLYLSSKLSKRSDAHHYNTRKRDNLNLPLCRTVTAQRSFYYRAVSAWDSLTADTRNSPSLCTFKKSVKRELREKTPYVR